MSKNNKNLYVLSRKYFIKKLQIELIEKEIEKIENSKDSTMSGISGATKAKEDIKKALQIKNLKVVKAALIKEKERIGNLNLSIKKVVKFIDKNRKLPPDVISQKPKK